MWGSVRWKLGPDMGVLVGLLFLNPAAGAAIGAMIGAGFLLMAAGTNTAAARFAALVVLLLPEARLC